MMDSTSQETLSTKYSALITSLSQERATESNAIEMPKGERTLKGISEKFEVNSANIDQELKEHTSQVY